MPSNPSPALSFTLDDLLHSAGALEKTRPDTIVLYRLWKEVLRIPADNSNLQIMAQQARRNWRVRQLETAQQPDGSWGRFHSEDTGSKNAVRTSEEAIQRLLALGLEAGDPLLERARQYILDALAGKREISDPPEKNERWSFFVQLMLAGRLAQLDPGSPLLEPHWQYWLQVAQAAFASGNYSLEDEAAVYPALTGIRAPQGFLESEYALRVLSSRPLPTGLDQALVRWIWEKPDGIRYVRVRLQEPPTRQLGYWLRSMDILSRFAGWREAAAPALNQLWEQHNHDHLWDFGQEVLKSAEFPLSDTWRKPGSRQADHSIWILSLLRRALDGSSTW